MVKVKDKERILKPARKQQPPQLITYKRNPKRLSSDFSAETLQVRMEWNDIFKVLKVKNFQPRILYLARLSFRMEGKNKSFPDKQKFKEFTNTKPAL